MCSTKARGRLEGNAEGGPGLLSGPLAPDPVMYPGFYSARAPRAPRISPNATHILERGQKGVVGALLKLDGISLSPNPPKHSKDKQYLLTGSSRPPLYDFFSSHS